MPNVYSLMSRHMPTYNFGIFATVCHHNYYDITFAYVYIHSGGLPGMSIVEGLNVRLFSAVCQNLN